MDVLLQTVCVLHKLSQKRLNKYNRIQYSKNHYRMVPRT